MGFGPVTFIKKTKPILTPPVVAAEAVVHGPGLAAAQLKNDVGVAVVIIEHDGNRILILYVPPVMKLGKLSVLALLAPMSATVLFESTLVKLPLNKFEKDDDVAV